jgi:hypothetical protein
MIRFRTSQLDSLPSEACQVRVRIGTHQQQIVDAWFHRNPANPYIAGPEIVAFIKSQVPRDETRAILLTEENDHLLCINDDAELDDPLAYGVSDILSDGCFLNVEYIERILNRLTEKRNLILQGPPGTGKTWLAQRLGLALIGRVVQEPQLRIVQFHPNLSLRRFRARLEAIRRGQALSPRRCIPADG